MAGSTADKYTDPDHVTEIACCHLYCVMFIHLSFLSKGIFNQLMENSIIPKNSNKRSTSDNLEEETLILIKYRDSVLPTIKK